MALNNIKTANSSYQNLNTDSFKNRSDKSGNVDYKKLGKASDVLVEDEKDVHDNELIFFSDDLNFKIYKFNGKIAEDESHLGQNLDLRL